MNTRALLSIFLFSYATFLSGMETDQATSVPVLFTFVDKETEDTLASWELSPTEYAKLSLLSALASDYEESKAHTIPVASNIGSGITELQKHWTTLHQALEQNSHRPLKKWLRKNTIGNRSCVEMVNAADFLGMDIKADKISYLIKRQIKNLFNSDRPDLNVQYFEQLNPAFHDTFQYIAHRYLKPLVLFDESSSITIGAKKIKAVAWNPDGTLLAATSRNGQLQLWGQSENGQELTSVQHVDMIDCRTKKQRAIDELISVPAIAWNSDGTKLASTCGSNIALWEINKTTQQIAHDHTMYSQPLPSCLLEKNLTAVHTIVWHPNDPNKLFVGTLQAVLMFDRENRIGSIRPPEINGAIKNFEHNPGRSLLLITTCIPEYSSENPAAYLMDYTIHNHTGVFPKTKHTILGATAAIWHPTNSEQFLSAQYNTITIWTELHFSGTWNAACSFQHPDTTLPLSKLFVNPDGNTLISQRQYHDLYTVWNYDYASKGPKLKPIQIITANRPSDDQQKIAWHPHDGSFAYATKDGIHITKPYDMSQLSFGQKLLLALARKQNGGVNIAYHSDDLTTWYDTWDPKAKEVMAALIYQQSNKEEAVELLRASDFTPHQTICA